MTSNKWLIMIPLILILALTACSAQQATPAAQDAQASQNGQGTGTGTGGFGGGNTIEFRIPYGLLKLEGSDNAITPAEAKVLLPLFQQIQSLSSSNSGGGTPTSPQDIQKVYAQIQQALTSDQLGSIQNMTMSQDDISALAQSLGVAYTPQPQGTAFPTQSADQRATRTAQRQTQVASGTQVPGGPNGGFGGGRGGFGNLFIDPLIKLLQQRSGG
jgi:hypothetical protein